MTENSFVTLMQKCGMVMLDEKTSRPKVKLYKDEEGNFKGDALCTYIKVSVLLVFDCLMNFFPYFIPIVLSISVEASAS